MHYILPLGSSLQQLSSYVPRIVRHISTLEFDGDLPLSTANNTPFHGRQKGVAYRGMGRGGASAITAIAGRSGDKLDLNQVSTMTSG